MSDIWLDSLCYRSFAYSMHQGWPNFPALLATNQNLGTADSRGFFLFISSDAWTWQDLFINTKSPLNSALQANPTNENVLQTNSFIDLCIFWADKLYKKHTKTSLSPGKTTEKKRVALSARGKKRANTTFKSKTESTGLIPSVAFSCSNLLFWKIPLPSSRLKQI